MPLVHQLDQAFNQQLREDNDGFDNLARSGKQSINKLTVPIDPNLLSSERCKHYEEIVPTEEKLLKEI